MISRSMHQAVLAVAAGGLVLLGVAACDDEDEPIGPTTVTYRSTMNGGNERPTAVNTAATGTATYSLSGNTLTYTVTAQNLSGPATGAHIHVGGVTEAGPIVFPFNHTGIATGTIASGTINLSGTIIAGGITGDSLRVLLNNGNAYTNVHTALHPDGEIRGQILKQ